MALTTKLKTAANGLLSPLNLRLDTRTLERLEKRRIDKVAEAGGFRGPQFRILDCIRNNQSQEIAEALPKYREELSRFERPEDNDVSFSFDNGWYNSPDAEILYCMVREHKPAHIIEVGCGNSTRIIRQAIIDGNLASHLTSIDPEPRIDIATFSDEIIEQPVEYCSETELASRLAEDGLLFIDSSHTLNSGGDVTYLYLKLLPCLSPGVLIQIHDVFLPFDYPEAWARDWKWNEQYLLQAILEFGNHFDVVWPGYYLQKTVVDFQSYFPCTPHYTAQSFWVRRRVSEKAADS